MKVGILSFFMLYGANILIEDELHNVLLAEHERTQDRIDTKIKNRAYTGYDDDEFQDGQAGMRRKVLAKYDEDIDGPQEMVSLVDLIRPWLIAAKGFRLGSNAVSAKPVRGAEVTAPKVVNTTLLSIDYASKCRVLPLSTLLTTQFNRKLGYL